MKNFPRNFRENFKFSMFLSMVSRMVGNIVKRVLPKKCEKLKFEDFPDLQTFSTKFNGRKYVET